jgi:hypothetical protein
MKNQSYNLIYHQKIKSQNELKDVFVKVKKEFHFAEKKGEQKKTKY